MTEVGTIYGGALYDLAADEGLEEEILAQLQVLNQSFAQEPDFLKLLSAHHVPKEERCNILQESFGGKVHPYVLNFLKILTEKDYICQFSACYDAFRGRYNEAHHILPVTAVTAVALNENQAARLVQKLEERTGASIELTNRVDTHVLGGIRLEFDGKSMDDTLTHRLEAIRDLLNHTIL